MKFPSLSIENSNIPKTNCLPITRRRKEKRTIYFHLRFDVSLNDAIDPTGERGGGEGSVDPRRRGGEARSDGKRADSFMAGQMERFERAVSHECESLAMRVVWKRKSSGDRDDSLFEARSPDVPSFSGIPQDVHVCPTPVEGSASCRHRASKDRRKLCANHAQVSSRLSLFAVEFRGWIWWMRRVISRGKEWWRKLSWQVTLKIVHHMVS